MCERQKEKTERDKQRQGSWGTEQRGETGGRRRWREEKQTRESTQRTIIVLLSLTVCCAPPTHTKSSCLLHWCNATLESLSTVLKHACSHICLTCSPCVKRRTEMSALLRITSCACESHVAINTAHVFPLHPQVALHSFSVLSDRSAVGGGAEELDSLDSPIFTPIMPHTCVVLPSARNPTANKMIKSCSPRCRLDATLREQHTDWLTNRRRAR